MEDLMNRNRKSPDPAFARELYARIDKENTPMSTRSRLKLPLAGLAVAVAAAGALSIPSVSAAAQSFLNLFRVKRITAVSIDPARMQAMRQGMKDSDLKALMGESVVVNKPQQEPQVVTDAAAASALAGIPVKLPSAGVTELRVMPGSDARITGDSNKLAAVLQLMNITDVAVPAGLDGAVIDIKTPAMVSARIGSGRGEITLLQAKSPDITLPDGVSMAQLGEIALRVMGLTADEARDMAARIDWNSTLVVPIPSNAASFREVTVNGASGLLITTTRQPAENAEANVGGPRQMRGGSVVMWSDGDVVYAVQGQVEAVELIALAESLR
jgi:hypothetical protein